MNKNNFFAWLDEYASQAKKGIEFYSTQSINSSETVLISMQNNITEPRLFNKQFKALRIVGFYDLNGQEKSSEIKVRLGKDGRDGDQKYFLLSAGEKIESDKMISSFSLEYDYQDTNCLIEISSDTKTVSNKFKSIGQTRIVEKPAKYQNVTIESGGGTVLDTNGNYVNRVRIFGFVKDGDTLDVFSNSSKILSVYTLAGTQEFFNFEFLAPLGTQVMCDFSINFNGSTASIFMEGYDYE